MFQPSSICSHVVLTNLLFPNSNSYKFNPPILLCMDKSHFAPVGGTKPQENLPTSADCFGPSAALGRGTGPMGLWAPAQRNSRPSPQVHKTMSAPSCESGFEWDKSGQIRCLWLAKSVACKSVRQKSLAQPAPKQHPVRNKTLTGLFRH